jgi:hypothetical protein
MAEDKFAIIPRPGQGDLGRRINLKTNMFLVSEVCGLRGLTGWLGLARVRTEGFCVSVHFDHGGSAQAFGR